MNKSASKVNQPGFLKQLFFLGILFVFICILLECIGRIVLAFYPEDYFITKFEQTNRFQTDYTFGWDWRPGYKTIDNKFGKLVTLTVSQQSFKDREFSLVKPPNTIRIAVVGDSIVEGVGVNNDQTSPKVLERMLNSQSNAKKFEVINAGVSDYCLAQEYFYIKKKIVNFHPDIIIVGYYLNDGRDFARPKNFYGGTVLKYLLEKSSFVKWLNLYVTKVAIKMQYKHWEKGRERWMDLHKDTNWKNDPAALEKLITAADRDWGSAWLESGKMNTEKYLKEVNNLSKIYNFKLVFLCFPLDVQLYAKNPGKIDLLEPQKFMKQLCKENNIYFLDIFDALKKHKDEKIYYDHCHFTELGQEIVAGDIKEFLLSNNIVKE
ncbi:MAG: SGNH/GDSL hydrolase family protein [Candidatus Omnitrophica bacterium]|nr:SGNH/GDSL hydrolase family protein [Candidatus Omnitrophota bacterium]